MQVCSRSVTNTMYYLHSSLVITQVKSTVANPQVCMLLSLPNITLKLDDQLIQMCFLV